MSPLTLVDDRPPLIVDIGWVKFCVAYYLLRCDKFVCCAVAAIWRSTCVNSLCQMLLMRLFVPSHITMHRFIHWCCWMYRFIALWYISWFQLYFHVISACVWHGWQPWAVVRCAQFCWLPVKCHNLYILCHCCVSFCSLTRLQAQY